MTEQPDEAALAAIASIDGVGPARFRWLLTLGEPPEVLARLRSGRLPRAPERLRISGETVDAWKSKARAADEAAIWADCERRGIGVTARGSVAYPPRLVHDPDGPAVLFHLGDPDVLCAPTVAIVGTRRPTGYGRRVALDLGQQLAAAGVAVVSGLALGIDAAAHRGALEPEQSTPVGVVAAGLDAPCPVRTRDVASAVAGRGLLLSEVPPGTSASRWRFPVRNRVVAALADAVVVVESAPAGGSMHTVREAMERDVPVLSVPGPIDSEVSCGTNELLRDGAHPLLDIEDVFGVLPMVDRAADGSVRSDSDRRPQVGPAAEQVLDVLGWRPMSVGAIAEQAGMAVRDVSSAITELEAARRARRAGGWIERIAR